jgi:hypothetical protein
MGAVAELTFGGMPAYREWIGNACARPLAGAGSPKPASWSDVVEIQYVLAKNGPVTLEVEIMAMQNWIYKRAEAHRAVGCDDLDVAMSKAQQEYDGLYNANFRRTPY